MKFLALPLVVALATTALPIRAIEISARHLEEVKGWTGYTGKSDDTVAREYFAQKLKDGEKLPHGASSFKLRIKPERGSTEPLQWCSATWIGDGQAGSYLLTSLACVERLAGSSSAPYAIVEDAHGKRVAEGQAAALRVPAQHTASSPGHELGLVKLAFTAAFAQQAGAAPTVRSSARDARAGAWQPTLGDSWYIGHGARGVDQVMSFGDTPAGASATMMRGKVVARGDFATRFGFPYDPAHSNTAVFGTRATSGDEGAGVFQRTHSRAEPQLVGVVTGIEEYGTSIAYLQTGFTAWFNQKKNDATAFAQALSGHNRAYERAARDAHGAAPWSRGGAG